MNYMRKTNMGLSRFTSIKIGGVADVVYFPMDEKGVSEAFAEIKKDGQSFFILGGGSNVVIDDGKLNCAVILTSHLSHHRFTGNGMWAEAGLNVSILSELAANNRYSGLEFCYGLPGTVGGAVFMNARAYEQQMADIVESVRVYDYERHEILTLSGEECGFDYKTSVFQKKPYFILQVSFKLKAGADKAEIWRVMNKYKHDRKEKGHYLYPSAGCAFKNNRTAGVPSGKLIEELGLKGFRMGGVRVSEKHGNFLINYGGATYKDYQKMVAFIQEKALKEKQIELECEVRFLP